MWSGLLWAGKCGRLAQTKRKGNERKRNNRILASRGPAAQPKAKRLSGRRVMRNPKMSGLRLFIGAAALVVVWAMGPMACAVHAHTYYVATTGNDANAGTMARPWRTIQHAAETVQ